MSTTKGDPMTIEEHAKTAVANAYRLLEGKNANPICTDEMIAVARENDSAESEDPICLYRYFCTFSHGEWYVMDGHKRTDGQIILCAFACLGDPDAAEVGDVPLTPCGGDGLADVKHPLFKSVAGVELDRYYSPEPLSKVVARVKGGAK